MEMSPYVLGTKYIRPPGIPMRIPKFNPKLLFLEQINVYNKYISLILIVAERK